MATNLFSLRGFSLSKILKRSLGEINDDDVFGRAAELAYYFFLALFPLLISIIATLSVFGYADRGRALLAQSLTSVLPPAASALINSTIGGIIHTGGPLKMSFGILGSLWAASAGMRAIMDTLNSAYRVQERRSFLKLYSVAAALTIVMAILVVAAIAALVLGNSIINAVSDGKIPTDIWKVIQWPVVLALSLLALAIVYYFGPDVRQREWHWITPGAIAGVILWIIVTIALRIYLHFFHSYNAAYGSLAAVIILLLWFYLSGIAVLSGAVINSILQRIADTGSIQPPPR